LEIFAAQLPTRRPVPPVPPILSIPDECPPEAVVNFGVMYPKSTCLLLPLLLAALPAARLAAFSPYEEAPIHYSKTEPRDAVRRLQAELDSGRWRASREDPRALLREVLGRLQVPEESQVLVFSKTSKQLARIHPRNPRAMYFSDNAYVGWVPGGEIEVVDFDPHLGMVFYLFAFTDADRPPTFVRDPSCLDCHANSATLHVPGVVVRSVFPDPDGQPLLSGGSFFTNHESPIHERWGGWYVTGSHGALRHMGNSFARVDPANGRVSLDPEPGANREDLRGYFPADLHLRPGSDIIALMVLEHQVAVHNQLCAASVEVRRAQHFQSALAAMDPQRSAADAGELSGTALVVARSQVEKLLRLMLFSGEADLHGEGVDGDPAFQDAFQRGVPRSRDGRSLKDFQLSSRLFKYRCSYLIYSEAFANLPAPLRSMFYARLWEILQGRDTSPEFAHLGATERSRIAEILADTLPDLPDLWRAGTDLP
jgi:hypothetical protein